jgi:hypothetical protein
LQLNLVANSSVAASSVLGLVLVLIAVLQTHQVPAWARNDVNRAGHPTFETFIEDGLYYVDFLSLMDRGFEVQTKLEGHSRTNISSDTLQRLDNLFEESRSIHGFRHRDGFLRDRRRWSLSRDIQFLRDTIRSDSIRVSDSGEVLSELIQSDRLKEVQFRFLVVVKLSQILMARSLDRIDFSRGNAGVSGIGDEDFVLGLWQRLTELEAGAIAKLTDGKGLGALRLIRRRNPLTEVLLFQPRNLRYLQGLYQELDSASSRCRWLLDASRPNILLKD